MAPEERYSPDQQFGAEAARDEERADDARSTSAEGAVAADMDRKSPRPANKAEPAADGPGA